MLYFSQGDDFMKKFAQRLAEAMEIRDMSQAELALKSLISKSSISTYLKGSFMPKQENITKLARELHVSEEWLMGKDVPMDPSAPKITNDMLKFALFNGEDGITDQMLDEVKAFAQYVKQKNR